MPSMSHQEILAKGARGGGRRDQARQARDRDRHGRGARRPGRSQRPTWRSTWPAGSSARKLNAADHRPVDRRAVGQLPATRQRAQLTESDARSCSPCESSPPILNDDAGAIDVGHAQRSPTVYAKALLGGDARTPAIPAAVLEELDALVDEVLGKLPQARPGACSGALISAGDKRQIVDRVLAGKRLAAGVELPQGAGRARAAGQSCARCAAWRTELYDEMRGIVRVEVATATPVDDELSAQIADNDCGPCSAASPARPHGRSRADRRRRAACGRHRVTTVRWPHA